MDNLRIRVELSSQISRRKAKLELNSVYGICVSEYVKSVYHSGKTVSEAVCYADTDSVIVSHDEALCMYDHAGEILEVN